MCVHHVTTVSALAQSAMFHFWGHMPWSITAILYVKSFYSFMSFYCIYLVESAHMEVKGQLAGAISVLPPPPSGMELRSSDLAASTFTHGARSPILEKSFGGRGSFLKLYISHPALSS